MRLERWHIDLIRNLFPFNGAKIQHEAAFAAKSPHIPAKLYKYRSFAEPFHRQALEANELWFSSPNRFNDLFDSVAKFKLANLPVQRRSLEEQLAEFDRILALEATGARDTFQPITDPVSYAAWFAETCEPLLNQLEPDDRAVVTKIFTDRTAEVQSELNSGFSAMLQQGFSVLSLTDHPTSNLMWAHYAASHTGFCLEYDFSKLPEDDTLKRMCFPVFYRHRRVDISRYLEGAADRFNPHVGLYLCLMKGDEWRYEREWRVAFASGEALANRPYAMPLPSALIVGAGVRAEDLDFARKLCARRNIPVRQAKPGNDSLGLMLESV